MLSSSVCHLRILHFTGEVVGLTCTFVWSDDIQSPYLVQYHQLPRLSPWRVFVHGPWSLDSGAGRRRFTPWLTTHKPGDACQLPKCPLHFSTWNLGHRWWPCWVSVETEWTDTLIFETCLQWGSEYSGYLCAYPHPCPRRPLKVEATPYTLVSSIPSTTRNAGGAHWDVTSPSWKATDSLRLSRVNFSRLRESPIFISGPIHSTQWCDFTAVEVRNSFILLGIYNEPGKHNSWDNQISRHICLYKLTLQCCL